MFDITEKEFDKVTVSRLENNSIEALFDSGVFLQAKGDNGFISSIQIYLPEKFRNNTHGLLGTFNGNILDDLMPKFGDTPLPPNVSAEDIHNKFGITCELNILLYGLEYIIVPLVYMYIIIYNYMLGTAFF